MKYSFSKYLWASKSNQIWHKNVFKFFKFSGMNLGWGGISLDPKMGTSVGWVGIDKIFAGWGYPKSPPEKKTLWLFSILIESGPIRTQVCLCMEWPVKQTYNQTNNVAYTVLDEYRLFGQLTRVFLVSCYNTGTGVFLFVCMRLFLEVQVTKLGR